VIPDTLNHVNQGELQMYENNYNALNLITTVLGRNVYDRLAHLKMAHDVWLKLCNTYEGLALPLFLYFVGFCGFSPLDDLSELFLSFWVF
jgi:hypothetical protein